MSLWAVPWTCALLMSLCLNFSGFPLFVKLTDIMIGTKAPSKLREVALQRTIEKPVEPFESYLASSFCILLHTTSIESSCMLDPRTCHPNQVQRFQACILAPLHWNTFRMYPVNLFTSRSQHKIFGQVPTVDIIPESSSSFLDLIIFKRNFWSWAERG